jgi:hypothetical protein
MPPDTVKVSRPGIFGNPFTEAALAEAGYSLSRDGARSYLVQCFRRWLEGRDQDLGAKSDTLRNDLLMALPSIRGKNLACWCPINGPCHADVLLELANAPTPPTVNSGDAKK